MLRPVRMSQTRAMASMPPDAASAPSFCRGVPGQRCYPPAQLHRDTFIAANNEQRLESLLGCRSAILTPIQPHLECYSVHRSAVPLLLLQALPRLNIPQPPCLVKASSTCRQIRQQGMCKWTLFSYASMAGTFQATMPNLLKPSLQTRVAAQTLTQMPPHGVEGDAPQPVGVPRQRAQQLAVARPQLGGGVGGARS